MRTHLKVLMVALALGSAACGDEIVDPGIVRDAAADAVGDGAKADAPSADGAADAATDGDRAAEASREAADEQEAGKGDAPTGD